MRNRNPNFSFFSRRREHASFYIWYFDDYDDNIVSSMMESFSEDSTPSFPDIYWRILKTLQLSNFCLAWMKNPFSSSRSIVYGAVKWLSEGSYRLSLKTYSSLHSRCSLWQGEDKKHICGNFHFTTKFHKQGKKLFSFRNSFVDGIFVSSSNKKKIVADLNRLWAMRYHLFLFAMLRRRNNQVNSSRNGGRE